MEKVTTNHTITGTDLNSMHLASARRRPDERQAADLEHIRTYYAMESRLGIRIELGSRVRHDSHEGVIVDTAGQRLKVLFVGDEAPRVRHATSQKTYETATGWITATPVPDPWATPKGA
ncbi:hypothetical protein ABTY61_40305 [Kitasatospora sp. NPDC096128]|uniref:hypothetical protein n=1 Tax=Kitasatospora sp. NPDC096128 TaxID=3155547 RepID=UPI0033262F73